MHPIKVLIVLGAVLQLNHVIAQIPDEIDVKKYEGIYLQSKSVSDQKRSTANHYSNEENKAAQQVQDINQSILEHEAFIQRGNSRLGVLDQRIFELDLDIRQMESKIDGLRSEISSAESKLSTLQSRLRSAQNEVDTTERELNRVSRLIEQLDQQIDKLNRALDVEKRRQADAERELSQLNAEERSLESRRNVLVTRIPHLRSEISNLNQEIKDLHAKIESLGNSNPTETAALRRQLQTKQSALERTKGDLNEAQQKVNELEAELKKNNSEQARAKNTIQDASSRARHIDAELNRPTSERRQLVSQHQSLSSQLQNQVRQRDALHEEVNQWAAHLHSLQNSKAETEHRLSTAQNELHASQSEKASLEDSIARSIRIVAEQKNELRRAEQTLAELTQLHRQAEAEAQQAETITAQHRQKYMAVKSHYDSLMVAARAEGVRQATALAKAEGGKFGSEKGTAAGLAEGLDLGTRYSGWNSFRAGVLHGQKTGKEDGHRTGFNAPENRERGYKDGYAAGQREAITEANNTSYHQGRRTQRDALLAQTPHSVIELFNSDRSNNFVTPQGGIPIFHPESTARLSDKNTQILLQSIDADAKADALVKNASQELLTLDRTMADLRETRIYPGSISIDPSRAVCQQSYVDFVNGCKTAFVDEYRTVFRSTYGDSYLAARNPQFDQTFPKTVEQHKNSRHQEGVEIIYSLVFEKWEHIGATEAERNGFVDGKKKGYADTIDGARTEAFQRGKDDENTYFANNSFVRVKDAMLSADDLSKGPIPGANVTLDLRAINFGQQGSAHDATRIFISPLSRNIGFSQTSVGLVGLPRSTQARVKRVVTGRIFEDAGWDEDVRVEVRAQYPDGQSDTRTVTLKTKFALTATGAIKTESRPIVKGLFGEHIDHEFKVSVTNLNRNVRQKGFRVVGQVPAGFPAISWKTPQGQLQALEKNQSGEVKLHYEIRDINYVDKQIPIEVIIYYDQNIEVGRAKVVVTPRKLL